MDNLCLKWILLCLTFIKCSWMKGPVYWRIYVHLTPNPSAAWWLMLPMIVTYILGHFPYAWLLAAFSLLFSNTDICCPYSMDTEAPCLSSFQTQHWTQSKRCCPNPTMQVVCNRKEWPFVTFGGGGGHPGGKLTFARPCILACLQAFEFSHTRGRKLPWVCPCAKGGLASVGDAPGRRSGLLKEENRI